MWLIQNIIIKNALKIMGDQFYYKFFMIGICDIFHVLFLKFKVTRCNNKIYYWILLSSKVFHNSWEEWYFFSFFVRRHTIFHTHYRNALASADYEFMTIEKCHSWRWTKNYWKLKNGGYKKMELLWNIFKSF